VTGRRRSVPGQGDANPGPAPVHEEQRSRHELGRDQHHEEDARASTDVHRAYIARRGTTSFAGNSSRAPVSSGQSCIARLPGQVGGGGQGSRRNRSSVRDFATIHRRAGRRHSRCDLVADERRDLALRGRRPRASELELVACSREIGPECASHLGRVARSRHVHPLGPKCLRHEPGPAAAGHSS
jgi:hypothetical protein